jgi:hypothetical protein
MASAFTWYVGSDLVILNFTDLGTRKWACLTWVSLRLFRSDGTLKRVVTKTSRVKKL